MGACPRMLYALCALLAAGPCQGADPGLAIGEGETVTLYLLQGLGGLPRNSAGGGLLDPAFGLGAWTGGERSGPAHPAAAGAPAAPLCLLAARPLGPTLLAGRPAPREPGALAQALEEEAAGAAIEE